MNFITSDIISFTLLSLHGTIIFSSASSQHDSILSNFYMYTSMILPKFIDCKLLPTSIALKLVKMLQGLGNQLSPQTCGMVSLWLLNRKLIWLPVQKDKLSDTSRLDVCLFFTSKQPRHKGCMANMEIPCVRIMEFFKCVACQFPYMSFEVKGPFWL